MATQPLPDIPEGFDSLSKEQQFAYVHALWDRIASSQDEVPVPQWHRDLLRQRLDSRDSSEDTTWSHLLHHSHIHCQVGGRLVPKPSVFTATEDGRDPITLAELDAVSLPGL